MQVTVELQDMFSYSAGWIILLLVLIIVPIIWLLIKVIKVSDSKPNTTTINANIKGNTPAVKEKYLRKVADIEKSFAQGQITDKAAYQELSAIMRFFVYEMTGIKAQNFTLQEIQAAGVPQLYELIKEYYVPEFALEYSSHIQDSLDRARKVIYQWN